MPLEIKLSPKWNGKVNNIFFQTWGYHGLIFVVVVVNLNALNSERSAMYYLATLKVLILREKKKRCSFFHYQTQEFIIS